MPKSRVSPTQRSLKYLREQGYHVGVVEHWNGYVGIRQDLFGFADLIAVKEGCPIMAVQTTSYSNTSARVKKIRSIPESEVWLKAGGVISIHGWKSEPHGKVKKWSVRVIDYQG